MTFTVRHIKLGASGTKRLVVFSGYVIVVTKEIQTSFVRNILISTTIVRKFSFQERRDFIKLKEKTRAPMLPSRRATIFRMFSAIKGLKEVLTEKKLLSKRILVTDITEKLNRKLKLLKTEPLLL